MNDRWNEFWNSVESREGKDFLWVAPELDVYICVLADRTEGTALGVLPGAHDMQWQFEPSDMDDLFELHYLLSARKRAADLATRKLVGLDQDLDDLKQQTAELKALKDYYHSVIEDWRYLDEK